MNISNVIVNGNTANEGGAMYLGASSTNFVNNVINLKSGEISNNTATSNYGGIWAADLKEFNMSGGSIINNKNTNSQGTGGLYVSSSVGSYKKTGGTISGNTPTDVGGKATK